MLGRLLFSFCFGSLKLSSVFKQFAYYIVRVLNSQIKFSYSDLLQLLLLLCSVIVVVFCLFVVVVGEKILHSLAHYVSLEARYISGWRRKAGAVSFNKISQRHDNFLKSGQTASDRIVESIYQAPATQ